jgi:hypothetical protein
MAANAVGRTKKVGGKAYFTGHFSLEELQLVGIREFGTDTLPHKIGDQRITVADDTNNISSLFQGCHHIFYIMHHVDATGNVQQFVHGATF